MLLVISQKVDPKDVYPSLEFKVLKDLNSVQWEYNILYTIYTIYYNT